MEEKIIRDRCLYYKRGVKYVSTRDYFIKLDVIPYAPIDLDWVKMDMEGNTIVYRKFYWDGCSGPAPDTDENMIAGFIHDLGYKLIRLGLIDPKYKPYFDELLRILYREDGGWEIITDVFKWSVLNFGDGSCRPSSEPLEMVAP